MVTVVGHLAGIRHDLPAFLVAQNNSRATELI
jgi:hypothetical protein